MIFHRGKQGGNKMTSNYGSSTIVKSTAKNLVFCAALLLASLLARPVSATPLNLSLQFSPDVMSSFVTVNYNASTGAFNADGFVSSYNGPTSPSHDITDYNFDITATIDAGGTFGHGSLDIWYYLDPSDHLLTGELFAFGYSDHLLEFLFNNLQGPLQSDFGAVAAVTLEDNDFITTPGQSFGDSFPTVTANYYTSDTGVPAVPEPSTISLLLLGVGGMVLARRRRSEKIV
jgi:hypothetical protein